MAELVTRAKTERERLARYNFDGPLWKTLVEIGASTYDVPDLNGLKRRGLVSYRPAWDSDFPSEWSLTPKGEEVLYG